MSTGVARRVTGHALLVWLLYQGVAPMIQGASVEGVGVVRSFETEAECQRAATMRRAIRGVIVLRGVAAIEVFSCLPDNADPTLAEWEDHR